MGSQNLRKGYADTVTLLVKTGVDTYPQESCMEIWDLRFSEWWRWYLKSSVIWCSFGWWIIQTFRTIVLPLPLQSKGPWPWRWINHDPSKCQELLTELHIVIAKKIWHFWMYNSYAVNAKWPLSVSCVVLLCISSVQQQIWMWQMDQNSGYVSVI